MSKHHIAAGWTSTVSAIWRKRIAAQLPLPCIDRCGQLVHDGQSWQVGHVLSISLYPELSQDPGNIGPSHRRCNASAGGKQGAAKTNQMRAAKRAETERMFNL